MKIVPVKAYKDMYAQISKSGVYTVAVINDAATNIIKKNKMTRQAKNKKEYISIADKFYNSWRERKRSGKFRYITKVIDPNLTRIHRMIVNYIPLPCHQAVYSYRKNISVRKCAARHVGKFAKWELDLQEYFYSITRSMIEQLYIEALTQMEKHTGVFISKQQIFELADKIAFLTTRSHPDGKKTEEAVMPIGIIPASVISNSVFYMLDEKLWNMAKKEDITYTRYSDNLFFSKKDDHIPREFQEKVVQLLESYTFGTHTPFKVNKKKTRYSPYWRRQKVLGIVVNDHCNIPKERVSYIRSALNHLFYDSLDALESIQSGAYSFEEKEKLIDDLQTQYRKTHGVMSYVFSVSEKKFLKYSSQLYAIKLVLDEAEYEISTQFKTNVANIMEE